ncbi:DUF3124 domain-containing protein [Ulvibacterium marinum]|uniref:DUF3124 domain-containing protein n=2 Tax=Ulvibacterium marinum TaxID=2419782 RepID=A0A3B0BQR7_9FLAO|nr:DUF3124 domain-containing protein [Ulvibacterium marinum]
MGCNEKEKQPKFKLPNWSARHADIPSNDSLQIGKSYLSIYSQIYTLNEERKSNLTAMTSLRNTSEKDTIYISRADYYDTYGVLIRHYLNKTIFIRPLETLEIVIEETDDEGGTGSNFIFEWQKPISCPEPMFEGVMSSTIGQQGLSFTTRSRRIE